MIKVLLLVIISTFILSEGLARAAQRISLAIDSKPLFTIVVPTEPSPQESNAANELKLYLDRITGGDFSIVKESVATRSNKSIYIGHTNALAKSFPDFKPDSLGKDGIFLKTSNTGDIFITGKGSRGTLYAASTFLEEYCKVRWWAPGVESVPADPNLKISTPNQVYSPQMDYRDSWFLGFNNFGGIGPVDDEARIKFCVHLKNNGFFNGIPAEWGGATVCLPGAWPVFSRLMPYDRYFNEHPEWFSEIDGKRVPAQLCLSNEEMRKEMARNLLDMIRATPGVDMITITQNDSGKDDYCHCAKCRAVDANEGAPAGILLQCVNAIAEIVEKEYPDLYINTLAYSYTMNPPLVTKPRANVSLQVCCPSDANRFDSPVNKKFLDGLRAWSRMSERMMAWTYLVDYGDILNPIPNTFNIGPNIKTLAKYKVKGFFAQGNSFAPIGDFPELKAWLIAKLLWNPSLNDKALVKEFMAAYYKDSAKPLYKYLELVTNEYASLTPEAKAKAFSHNAYASPPILSPWMGLDAMNKATNLFDEAEKLAANNPQQLERVKCARQSLEFQWIIGWKEYKSLADKDGKQFLGPTDQLEAFNTFIENSKKRYVWRLCEGNGSLNILYGAIFNK